MDHKEEAEELLGDVIPTQQNKLLRALTHAVIHLAECWEELTVVAIQVDDEDEIQDSR